MRLTDTMKNFVWFFRLQWVAYSNLITSVNADEVFVALLQVSNAELLHVFLATANLNPHRLFDVANGDIVS